MRINHNLPDIPQFNGLEVHLIKKIIIYYCNILTWLYKIYHNFSTTL